MNKALIIIFLLLFSFSAFSESTVDILTKRLELTSELLKEVINENVVLVKKVSKLEDETKKLSDSKNLLDENKKLNSLLDKATDQIEENMDTIVELTNQIKEDSDDIKELRNQLKINFNSYKPVEVGLAVIYPWGGQILLSINLKPIPLGFFSTMSLAYDKKLIAIIGLGAKIRF